MKSLLNALKEGRLIELPVAEKEKALEYLAHLIEAIPDLSGIPELAEAMIARERSQNTGLGLGVACPHVRTAGSGELVCAVGWSPSGIDYGSYDNKKVHLIVMYFIPDSQKNTYLKEVSSLAGAIQKEGGIQAIASAEDIATVRERLLDWVSSAIETSIPETKARMIRLESRQAIAEAVPIAGGAQEVQVFPVLFLASGGERTVILCQNGALASLLEKENNLGSVFKQKGQFEKNGYRFVFRSATSFEFDRTLYDYLAIKF